MRAFSNTLRGLMLCVALGAGCDSASQNDDTGAGPGNENATCDEGGAFSESALRARIGFLADPAQGGRVSGSAGDAATREHIAARFTCLGLDAPGDTYEQPFKDSEGSDTANVIGVLPGSDPELSDEIIVIGAHHDHLGEDDTGLYPGANDNASGVATMLAVAQAMSERETAPRRTLVFVAFGAEEVDLDGSADYIAHPPAGLPLAQTVFMVNLDMVGTYEAEGVLNALDAGPDTVARAALEAVMDDFPGLKLNLDDTGDSSDSVNFCEVGVPGVFFHTTDPDCYHETCDTADNVDYPHLVQTAQLVSAMVEVLADGDLDLAASREAGCTLPEE